MELPGLVELSLPPLMTGKPVMDGTAPFEAAVSAARAGTDPGLILYDPLSPDLEAAIVLAPEAPLGEALAMVLACMIGLSDALGALGPPEMAVHFRWPGEIRVNGATCGHVRAAASHSDPAAEPDWLVLGVALAFRLEGPAGARPDVTALENEGCGDLTPADLTEAWARHFLVWINRWLDDGMAPLHADWRARAADIGDEIRITIGGETHEGRFTGLDEAGGMLLQSEGKTRLLPLTAFLEDTL